LTAPTDTKEIPADQPVTVTFAELGLDPKIIKALDDMGYERPTPIQAQAIPFALKGQDVLGIAQTGTGKTGAFTLPTVHKMASGRARARMPRCLIICPTRELAAQVAENVEMYGKYLKLEMALLIGGVSFAEQDKKLITPFTRQVLFFSATMPVEIKRLVDQFLHQPATVQIARKNMTAKTVTQRIVRLPKSDAKMKRTALRWIIDNSDVDNGIVFCNRKRDVDIVAKSLSKHGHSSAPIHGDLPQSLRTETLESFKNGEIKLLVASDVAARGLDVPSVSHVFNYDVPSHSEDYVHRIGRTGRAGRKGDTVMFVARLDEKNYDAILNLIKVDAIEELEIPGLEDFPTEDKRRKGGRNSNSRDRGRGRNNKSRHRSNERSDNSRSQPHQSDHTQPEETKSKAPRKNTDSRRRKAPAGRKKSEPQQEGSDTVSEKRPEVHKSEKPQRSKKPSNKTRSDNKHKKRGPSSNQNKKQSNEKSKIAGFGDDVPAFFKNSF